MCHLSSGTWTFLERLQARCTRSAPHCSRRCDRYRGSPGPRASWNVLRRKRREIPKATASRATCPRSGCHDTPSIRGCFTHCWWFWRWLVNLLLGVPHWINSRSPFGTPRWKPGAGTCFLTKFQPNFSLKNVRPQFFSFWSPFTYCRTLILNKRWNQRISAEGTPFQSIFAISRARVV